MAQKLPIRLSTVKIASRLFVFVMIFGVFVFLNEMQEPILPVVDKPATNQAIIPPTVPEKSPTVDPGTRSVSISPKKAEQMFHSIIIQAANRNQVDPALVKAIIMAESSYNPRAISKKGAKGLMQLMPGTAKALGVENSFDPEHNINAGVRYFKQLLNQFDGNMKLALAAYNAGSRKVRQYQGVPPYKVTQYYITKVCKYYQHYQKLMALESDHV